MRWTVAGDPASFATAGERPWKETLARTIPKAPEGICHKGLEVSFRLRPDVTVKDVDNLCDPVFSVVVNRLGYFGGKRPNIRWWRATRQTAPAAGCTIALADGPPPPLPDTPPVLDAVYCSAMPTSAQDTAMAEWVRGHQAQDFGARAAFCVSLQFGGDAINLGDVATGRVKNLIDCLYPVLGGRPGAPEDWRIEALQVEKGGSCEAGSVHIRVWAWPGESGSLEHLQHAVATEAGTDGARLQQLLAQHLAVLLPPVQAMREGNSIIMSRSAEFELCIAPDRLWMQTVRTRWDGHTPVPEVDRELWLRLESRPGEAPESAALRVTALVQIVFGERLASYTRCEDCGNRFPPEQMTDAWCHGCAHRHGIVY